MKRLLILAGLVILIGGGVGFFIYNKPHADLMDAEPDFAMDVRALFQAFESDEVAANSMYLDKVIEVNGVLREMVDVDDGGKVLTLKKGDDMFGVSCAFLDGSQVGELAMGSAVTIRGVCTGMLMDVNLSRCVLVQ